MDTILIIEDDKNIRSELSTLLKSNGYKCILIEDFTKENVQACIKATQKEAKVRGKMLYMPLRIATTGIMHGPDLASSICLLGKEKVLSRL